jgi:hypothetical protein
MGMDTVLTLDYATINSVLESAGVTNGTTANLKWIVKAKAGASELDASSSFLLNLEKGVVIDNFSLISPADGFEADITDDASQTIDVTWNSAGEGATYQWFLTTAADDYSNALVSGLASNNNGNDTVLTLDFATIYSILEGAGVAMGAQADLKWKVHAYGGNDSIPSSNNQLLLTRGSTTSISAISSDLNGPASFPNPISKSGSLNVVNLTDVSSVKIIDLTGNTVAEYENNDDELTIDLSELELNSGMYLLQYNGVEVSKSDRLIIE